MVQESLSLDENPRSYHHLKSSLVHCFLYDVIIRIDDVSLKGPIS
jgi:hypothetical protein